MYADPIFSIPAPQPENLEEFILGIRASAADFAMKAFAEKCGVLFFETSPLSSFLSVSNMALRTQVVELGETSIQKFLELLKLLASAQRDFSILTTQILQDVPLPLKQLVIDTAWEGDKFWSTIRGTIGDAIASVRCQKEGISIVGAISRMIELLSQADARGNKFAGSMIWSIKLAGEMTKAGVRYFNEVTGAQFLKREVYFTRLPVGFAAIFSVEKPLQVLGSDIVIHMIKKLAARGFPCTLIDLTVIFYVYRSFLDFSAVYHNTLS